VFHKTASSFALVNLKPLLPGHILICPQRRVPRFTDLTPAEVTDLMTLVQKAQYMLASIYFKSSSTSQLQQQAPASPLKEELDVLVRIGAFNIAIQDGPAAGQSVAHVHCHIIPRLPTDSKGDGIYAELADEEGNVGGHLWDQAVEKGTIRRPVAGGSFPKIEDADRMPRSREVMVEEARTFGEAMERLEGIE
jgi:bis(5'-adenosyl)-triphosphatase